MNAQEVVKKYGVWIAAGALVLYLVYRNTKGGGPRQSLTPAPGAAGISGDQYRLETERLRQAGALDVERLKINAQLEAERLRQAQQQFNLNAQLEAQRRAREAQERARALGLIGQIANAISNLFKGQASQQSKSGSSGSSSGSQGGWGTPSTFPGRPQLPPAYAIPEPNISVFNPPYTPEYPQISEYPLPVTDWGEAPQFSSVGMDIDTGASFFDQWGGDWAYEVGYGEASYDIYSSDPELEFTDYGEGAGVGTDPGGYTEEFYGFDFG
jgi:hypothetical protein